MPPSELSPTVVGAIAHRTLDTTTLSLRQVTILARHGLARAAALCLPSEPATDAEVSLARFARRQQMTSMKVVATASRVAHTLEALGVPALVYKGPAWTYLSTGSWTGRSSSDVDVLVAPVSLPTVYHHLRDVGLKPVDDSTTPPGRWTRYLECELVFTGWATSIDLHWRIDPTPGTCDLPFDDLWNRRVRVDSQGLSVWTTSPHDALIITAAHGTRSRWSHWQWALDAVYQLESIDPARWPSILELARRSGTARALDQCVAIAQLCGGVTPSGATPAAFAEAAAHLKEFTIPHKDENTTEAGLRRRMQTIRVADDARTALDTVVRATARQLAYRARQRSLTMGTLDRTPT